MKHSTPTPPKWADRLLRWLIPNHIAEYLIGDLHEYYTLRHEHSSSQVAKLHYILDVFSACWSFAFKKRLHSNHIIMLQHNLVLTFRNFKKHKSQFFINVSGLTAGLTCVLFIYLWIADERQMDTFHLNDARLYQIRSNYTDASGIATWTGVPGLLLPEVQSQVPEVDKATATTDTHELTLSADNHYIKSNGKFASGDFFNVFTYPLLEGHRNSALSDKSSIVLSKSLAHRLFKNNPPMGKTVTWHFQGNLKSFIVTGIMKDVPSHASEHFDFILPWDYFENDLIDYKTWDNYYGRIFVLLHSPSKKNEATTKIDQIIKDHQHDSRVDLFLAKYSDQYLYSNYENGLQAGGRIEYVRLFAIVAFFILFIACVNFINLSTAKASQRLKEIGVKKSLGATRSSLAGQYFTESVLLSLISLALALLCVVILLPSFNQLADKSIHPGISMSLTLTCLGLILTIGVVAGSYPALFLSGLKALDVLNGKLTKSSSWGRKALVITQFTLSITLIISVIVVYYQMQFVKSKNLGYDRDNLIYFEKEGQLTENYPAFVEALKALPGVKDAAVSGFGLNSLNSTGGVSWEGKTSEDQLQFWEIKSGNNLLEIMGIQVIDGRTFSSEFNDENSIILNETAVTEMGMEDPIGKTIVHYSGEKKIIGIVKDFNIASLHSQMEPTLFLYLPEEAFYVMAKLEREQELHTLKQMEETYHSFNPGYVFKPQFIDQDYQSLYASEEKVSVLSKYFAGLAIFISCLGLFGLASFTAQQRSKEIGIRKTLGATALGIVMMLSKEFTKMVLVAALIALPIGYLLTDRWLQDFAYRITLEWWFFALAGLGALFLAWFTVGLQTWKAARINPAECLKNE